MSNGHKIAALSFSVALALAGVVALLWLLGGPSVAHAEPGTLYVAPDGNDAYTCESQANRCATIQRAVDVASPNDVIKVATGVYTDLQGRPAPDEYDGPSVITQVIYISKTVTIQGGYTTTNWMTSYPITQPTTLDAQGQGRVIFITGDPSTSSGQAISPTIEGLRITGGDATGLGGRPWGDDAGGGVYVISATATISNNQVFSNTGGIGLLPTSFPSSGGGLYLRYSDATLMGNTVTSNTASFSGPTTYYGGGGLYLDYSDATFGGNTVTANYAYNGSGGGLYLRYSDATLSGNTVIANSATYGGGLYLVRTDATLSENTTMSNFALYGGGLYLLNSEAALSGNTILSNTAGRGGGLLLEGANAAALSGNTIMSNTAAEGGGLYLGEGDATLNGNTVMFNAAVDGGGFHLQYSGATFSRNIVISNTARHGGGLWLLGSDAMLNGDTIVSNTAEGGGGLFLFYSADTLINTVIADNQANDAGSGLYIYGSSPRLLHTTVARNSGGDGSGVYVTNRVGNYSTVALINTILVSHTVGISVTGGNTVTVNSILWHGTPITVSQATTATVTVQNQHQGDPLFAADGYHLMAGSAAIDKGVDAGVTTDIDGDPRDATPDLGADERGIAGGKVYLPVIMKDES